MLHATFPRLLNMVDASLNLFHLPASFSTIAKLHYLHSKSFNRTLHEKQSVWTFPFGRYVQTNRWNSTGDVMFTYLFALVFSESL